MQSDFLNNLYRPRTTLPLKGTHAKVQAALDFQSMLAIRYSQCWLNRQEEGVSYTSVHPKVPLAGIVRRALQVYMEHLDAPTTDLNTEAFMVRHACVSPGTPEEQQPACLERLDAAMSGPEPATFSEVLHGTELADAFKQSRAAHSAQVHSVPN